MVLSFTSPRTMSQGFRRLLALGAVFALAFIAVSALRMWRAGGSLRDLLSGREIPASLPEKATFPEHAPLELGDVELLARLDREYAKLTNAVVPSVVSINTMGIRRERWGLDPWGRVRERYYPTHGQGSGVIVSEEGHVVTNHHVIANQSQIQVTLHNGKSYPAILIGEDSLLDIAVLRVQAPEEDFTPLKLGNSSEVEVGQMVFAVGNPFGLGETVTSGIISAKERSLSDNQRDLFQTDAAINPGNSGGPLVNLRGEIIGINVAIFTLDRERPGFQGVGFSIPSNDVKEALKQILQRGRPVRGFLGVAFADDPRVVPGFVGRRGAAVRYVSPGSPAERAGLQPEDVVLSYGNEQVESSSALISMIQRTAAGQEVRLEVWRNGEIVQLTATIGESGPRTTSRTPQPEPASAAREILMAIGVAVRDLAPTERARGLHGVVVEEVASGGLAAGLLSPSDLILRINDTPVETARDFDEHLVATLPVQAARLDLLRGGRLLQVNLPPLPSE